jgi:polyphosphate glucokinase
MTPGQHAAPSRTPATPASPSAQTPHARLLALSALSTLSIDCGGTGLKAVLLDPAGEPVGERVRVPTPYPLAPEQFVATLVGLTGEISGYDRVTVGMPGMIRHGRVIATPHYPRMAGPFTPTDPVLVERWHGFDIQSALRRAYDRPTLVFNDAEVQGAAVVSGTGLELVLTLGTGLGCALFDDGALAPHLELSHHPFRRGQTYDQQLGNKARRAGSQERWVRRVRRAVAVLRPVFWFDRLYIGGGNAKYLPADLGPDVTLVPNSAGLTGGVRAWELLGGTA